MTVIRVGVCLAPALLLMSGAAAAQERRSGDFERSIERTADAVAAVVERQAEAFADYFERNAGKWAETFGRNAERWAEDFGRTAERWSKEFERNAEQWTRDLEVRVEARGQSSSAERRREAAERARELAREAEERAREADQRAREIQREQQERQREQQREQQERQREQQERDRERQGGRRGGPGWSNNWPEVTEGFSRTVRLGRTGVVSVENVSGDITVLGSSGSDVKIDAIKRVRHPNESQARALLKELEIDVVERGGRVEVSTRFPRARNNNTSGDIAYTLAVPNDADVVVRTVSGDVRVTNLRGELRAETTSGDVVLSGVPRVQSARTVSGNVEVTNVDGGDIAAGTVSGDVVVRGVKTRRLAVDSVTGDMRLTDVEAERVSVNTTNGDVEFSGRLVRGGRYEFSAHSGDVVIAPSGGVGFDLEANTFNGDVVSQYDLKLAPGTQPEGRRGLNRRIRGTYGDGAAVISVSSWNGDVTIVKR